MLLVRCILLLILFVLILIGNLLQTASLIVLPFSKRLQRRISSGVAGVWWFLLIKSLESAFNFSITVEGTIDPEDRSLLIIANHQNLVDPLVLLAIAQKSHTLPRLKWFIKESVLWYPFIGWGLWMLECVFLKRSWAEDQRKIHKAFGRMLAHRDPIWLISFVEGTRRTPEGIACSQAYAEKIHQAPLQTVLFPRVKGFVATVQALRPRMDAIYDLTFMYEKDPTGLRDIFWGRVAPIRVKLTKYPLSSVPTDPAALGQWLVQRFREKDEVLRQKDL